MRGEVRGELISSHHSWLGSELVSGQHRFGCSGPLRIVPVLHALRIMKEFSLHSVYNFVPSQPVSVGRWSLFRPSLRENFAYVFSVGEIRPTMMDSEQDFMSLTGVASSAEAQMWLAAANHDFEVAVNMYYTR